MHLDTVCTQIDYDKFTVYPGMYDELHAYRLRKGDNPGEIAVDELDGSLKEILEMATGVDEVTLIECGGGDPVEASREQWNDGSNTLAIAPGKVCVYERNVVTNDVLDRAASSCASCPPRSSPRPRRPALHVHALRPRRHLGARFGTVRPWPASVPVPVGAVSRPIPASLPARPLAVSATVPHFPHLRKR